jgi:hypothetical protein
MDTAASPTIGKNNRTMERFAATVCCRGLRIIEKLTKIPTRVPILQQRFGSVPFLLLWEYSVVTKLGVQI